MKKERKHILCFALLLVCLLAVTKTKVQAAATYVTNNTSSVVEAGGAKFEAKESYKNGVYRYKIVMKATGKSGDLSTGKDKKAVTLATGTTYNFATNGTLLFYSKYGKKAGLSEYGGYNYINTIYCLNIKTGKKTVIAKGKNFTVENCNGTYLYCGPDNSCDGIDLYAVNLKTKAKRHMVSGISSVIFYGKKTIAVPNTENGLNIVAYIFNQSGTGKTKIGSVHRLSLINGKIYGLIEKYDSNRRMLYRTFIFNPKTMKRKYISDWSSTYPDLFLAK
jgi:hypothetical protein